MFLGCGEGGCDALQHQRAGLLHRQIDLARQDRGFPAQFGGLLKQGFRLLHPFRAALVGHRGGVPVCDVRPVVQFAELVKQLRFPHGHFHSLAQGL